MQHRCTGPLRIDGAYHFFEGWAKKISLERPFPKNDDHTGLIHIIWLFDTGPVDGGRGMYSNVYYLDS